MRSPDNELKLELHSKDYLSAKQSENKENGDIQKYLYNNIGINEMAYPVESTLERNALLGGVQSPSLSDWVLKRLATS